MYYACIAISNGLHDVKSLSLFVSIEHKVFFHSGEQRNRYSCQGVGMVTIWRAHPNSPRGMNDIQTRIRNPPGYTHPIFNLTYHLPSYQPVCSITFCYHWYLYEFSATPVFMHVCGSLHRVFLYSLMY